jgi:hypothetical protein
MLRLQVGLEYKNRGPGERQGLGTHEMGNRHLQLGPCRCALFAAGSAVQRALDKPTASTTAARVSGSRWISVMGKDG